MENSTELAETFPAGTDGPRLCLALVLVASDHWEKWDLSQYLSVI